MDKDYCNTYCHQKNNFPIEKKPEFFSKISLILFDMDGVLVDTVSSWRFVHKYFSMDNQESVKAYIKGEIDDLEFIKKDVSKWKIQNKPITKKLLGTILRNISYMNGAEDCLKKNC